MCAGSKVQKIRKIFISFPAISQCSISRNNWMRISSIICAGSAQLKSRKNIHINISIYMVFNANLLALIGAINDLTYLIC